MASHLIVGIPKSVFTGATDTPHLPTPPSQHLLLPRSQVANAAAAVSAAVSAPWRTGTPPTAGKNRDERSFVRKTKAVETLHTKGWNVSSVGAGSSAGLKNPSSAKFLSATGRHADAAADATAASAMPAASGKKAHQGEREIRTGSGAGAGGSGRGAGGDGARADHCSSSCSSAGAASEASKPDKGAGSGVTIAAGRSVVICSSSTSAGPAGVRKGAGDAAAASAPSSGAAARAAASEKGSSGGGAVRNDGLGSSTAGAQRKANGDSSSGSPQQRPVGPDTEGDAVGDEGHGPRRGATHRFEGWENSGAASGAEEDERGEGGGGAGSAVGKRVCPKNRRLSPVADDPPSYVFPAAVHENEEQI